VELPDQMGTWVREFRSYSGPWGGDNRGGPTPITTENFVSVVSGIQEAIARQMAELGRLADFSHRFSAVIPQLNAFGEYVTHHLRNLAERTDNVPHILGSIQGTQASVGTLNQNQITMGGQISDIYGQLGRIGQAMEGFEAKIGEVKAYMASLAQPQGGPQASSSQMADFQALKNQIREVERGDQARAEILQNQIREVQDLVYVVQGTLQTTWLTDLQTTVAEQNQAREALALNFEKSLRRLENRTPGVGEPLADQAQNQGLQTQIENLRAEFRAALTGEVQAMTTRQAQAIEELRAESEVVNQTLEREVEKLRREVAGKDQEVQGWKTEVQRLRGEVQTLTSEVSKCQSDHESMHARLTHLSPNLSSHPMPPTSCPSVIIPLPSSSSVPILTQSQPVSVAGPSQGGRGSSQSGEAPPSSSCVMMGQTSPAEARGTEVQGTEARRVPHAHAISSASERLRMAEARETSDPGPDFDGPSQGALPMMFPALTDDTALHVHEQGPSDASRSRGIQPGRGPVDFSSAQSSAMQPSYHIMPSREGAAQPILRLGCDVPFGHDGLVDSFQREVPYSSQPIPLGPPMTSARGGGHLEEVSRVAGR
jgi:hypothetical protein